MKIKKTAVTALCLVLLAALAGCRKSPEKISPSVVIMPMFEIGDMAGDDPGEAQYYFEEYFTDPAVFKITDDPYGCSVYVQDDVALCLLGQGKAAAAVNVTALLTDERFDFSDTVFLVSGCAGSSEGSGVVGDVYIITAAVDYDLGHSVDARELTDESDPTWYRVSEYDPIGYHLISPALTEAAYGLTGAIPLRTTESARACMARNFGGAEWAVRDPQVLKGTSVTSDDYWKGEYRHRQAVYVTESYGAPDPYRARVMEASAIALTFKKLGMGDKLLILRYSVNVDVFIDGDTPESLWTDAGEVLPDGFDGFDDIFPVASENCFTVGKTIIEAVRNGEL